jgi:hypothetical protein
MCASRLDERLRQSGERSTHNNAVEAVDRPRTAARSLTAGRSTDTREIVCQRGGAHTKSPERDQL